ncbi:sensor histidine kinase [Verrucomicrobiota bacterium sgz303538]
MDAPYRRLTLQQGSARWLRARFLFAAFFGLLLPLSVYAGQTLTVSVDGKPRSVSPNDTVSISSEAKSVMLRFEADRQAVNPARIRFKLDGVDDRWRDGGGEMILAVRFLDASGEQFSQTSFKATGESAGWKGSLAQSTFTHRRETVPIPPGAASFWVVTSSAGPPATVGTYGVKGIVAHRLSPDGTAVPIDLASIGANLDGDEDKLPIGWSRDGSRRSMAKVANLNGPAHARALAIEDDDATAHAEWHTAKDAAPRIDGGMTLSLEWDEAFSIGISDAIQASYSGFAPGQYTFRIQQMDIQGVPVGEELRLRLIVSAPLWRSSWFWIAVASVVSAAAVGSTRYWERRRMRTEIARFKQERALDRERLRIARDIHDDLGARVTHISLISAMGSQKASDPEQASATFEQISQLTRDLVFALYQTVWAVDPENDSLEALVDHLCQIAGKQCAPANIRCRLYVDPLHAPLTVSSEARHNISMSVSEAVHNAVKHSRADEISLTVKILDSSLEISVTDNGRSFDPQRTKSGHGLANMRSRMEQIGGTVMLASKKGDGTKVHFSAPLSRLSGSGESSGDDENG